MRCVGSCPVNAIYPPNDFKYFPPPMDKLSCALRSKKLREELRSPCGICIKVCPVGADRKVFGRENMNIYSETDDFKVYHDAWKHVKQYGTRKEP